MKDTLPAGLNQAQWDAIMVGLSEHPSTLNDYRKIINLFYVWNNSTSITEATSQNAKDYFAELDERSARGEMSSNTAHRYQATLRAVGSRMEANQEVFPGFVNPFSGILHNEVRSRTKFVEKTFADPKDIEKFMRVIPTFPLEKQILLELMIHLGLRPYHIEHLKFSDFSIARKNSKELVLSFTDGTYVKKKNNYAKNNNSMVLDSVAQNGNKTYLIQVKWRFFEEYSSRLWSYHETLGKDDDDGLMFMTARKQPYGYRALHNLVQEANRRAGLPVSAITPYQLSLYGTVKSKLIYDNIAEKKKLKDSMSHSRSSSERTRAVTEIRKVDAQFMVLAEQGWIGGWIDSFPKTREILVDEVKKQLGKDSLMKIVY